MNIDYITSINNIIINRISLTYPFNPIFLDVKSFEIFPNFRVFCFELVYLCDINE